MFECFSAESVRESGYFVKFMGSCDGWFWWHFESSPREESVSKQEKLLASVSSQTRVLLRHDKNDDGDDDDDDNDDEWRLCGQKRKKGNGLPWETCHPISSSSVDDHHLQGHC